VLLVADAAFLIGMARAVSAVEIFSPQIAVFDDNAQVVASDGGFRAVPQTGTSFGHDLQPEQQAAEIGGRPPQSAAGLASRIEHGAVACVVGLVEHTIVVQANARERVERMLHPELVTRLVEKPELSRAIQRAKLD